MSNSISSKRKFNLLVFLTLTLVSACNSIKFSGGSSRRDNNKAAIPGPILEDKALSLDCQKLFSLKEPGIHNGSNGPKINSQASNSDLNFSVRETVLNVDSGRFGTVSAHRGDGVWCLESDQGEGQNSGTLYTASNGNYQVKIPLFCGRQHLVLGWKNENDVTSALTVLVNRTECIAGGMRLTLTWEPQVNDLELHLIQSGGVINNINGGFGDCTWTNMSPDWGQLGRVEDNPRKDIDWIHDRGVENIFLDSPLQGIYEVYVEYWAKGVPSNPTLTINLKGKTTIQNISDLQPQYVWHVGTISWPDANFTPKGEKIDCRGSWNAGCRLKLP